MSPKSRLFSSQSEELRFLQKANSSPPFGGSGGRGSLNHPTTLRNLLKYHLNIIKNLFIAKPDDFETALGQPLRSSLVVITLLLVNTAIDLNNQLMGMAVKIQDKVMNWMLPAKFQAK